MSRIHHARSGDYIVLKHPKPLDEHWDRAWSVLIGSVDIHSFSQAHQSGITYGHTPEAMTARHVLGRWALDGCIMVVP